MCLDQGPNGIVIGIVSDLGDNDAIGRVKVTFPHLQDQESHWARIVSPMAGPDRGAVFTPEVRDEVLVAFEHNDPRRPYILGAVWSKADPPPEGDGAPRQNNWRFIKSRSGHIFRFDDTDDNEKIELIDKDGKHTVTIDSAANSISVESASGNIDVTATKGKVTIHAVDVEINAVKDMSLSAGGTMTISGMAAVRIN